MCFIYLCIPCQRRGSPKVNLLSQRLTINCSYLWNIAYSSDSVWLSPYFMPSDILYFYNCLHFCIVVLSQWIKESWSSSTIISTNSSVSPLSTLIKQKLIWAVRNDKSLVKISSKVFSLEKSRKKNLLLGQHIWIPCAWQSEEGCKIRATIFGTEGMIRASARCLQWLWMN